MNTLAQLDPSLDESRYGTVLTFQARSLTLRAIWQRAYGEQYPMEVDPFGFVTLSEIERIATELRVSTGHLVADLGCGRGGPGLWVARRSGASLIGMDIIDEAIEQARQRIHAFGLEGRARFEVASFSATGLPAASLDGVMSVDALWMVLDKSAALREVARVLRPGGRFVFTTWEPSYLRHAAMLRRAGLQVRSSEEPQGWKARQLAVYAGILEEREHLVAELGEETAAVLVAEARTTPAQLEHSRRMLVVAAR